MTFAGEEAGKVTRAEIVVSNEGTPQKDMYGRNELYVDC
jgi:hypothetical protein